MKRAAVASLLFFFALPLFAQFGGLPGDNAPKASIEGVLNKRTGDEVEGTITAKIASGWHVNSHTPSEEFAIPTVIELDPATAELIEAKYPQHQMKAFEFTGGKSLWDPLESTCRHASLSIL